jgi:PfaD family protein
MTSAPAAPQWHSEDCRPAFTAAEIGTCVTRIREPLYLVADQETGRRGLALGGRLIADRTVTIASHGLVGVLPPMYPEWLGCRSFCDTHGVRFPYVAGEMANGISTTRMVIAMARAEMLSFFGAAGLDRSRIDSAVDELRAALGHLPNWGVNVIHNPNDPESEEWVAKTVVRKKVPKVSFSAFMALTPAVVFCAASGLHVDRAGHVVRPTQVFAKVSRPEVAAAFMSPPPVDMLRELVACGRLTESEAALAARMPVAEDITVEADSGGHTDNRPLAVLVPTIRAMAEASTARFGYPRSIRVGAAGGMGSPDAVAAAFGLGAAYVLTGSVNAAAVESGLSDDAKEMLAQADLADVVMAPSADMFEFGVKVQVLLRGTRYAGRAAQLYETYRAHAGLDEIPPMLRSTLERDIFGAPLEDIWSATQRYWQQRDPEQIAVAETDPKHRMALVFRWYLGMATRWAIDGHSSRRTDYQLWCGPAIGAFNRWVDGSFLAPLGNRSVVQIALNLLEGAAVITRAHQVRTFGIPVPTTTFAYAPRPLA